MIGVTVGGESEAPVSATSSNRVTVQDGGLGLATSGEALAKGGSAGATPGGTPATTTTATTAISTVATGTAGPQGTQPTTVTALGLQTTNRVESTVNLAATPAGIATGTATGYDLSYTQRVGITTDGKASALSDGSCAGPSCPTSTPAPAGSTALTTPAPMGSATLQGSGTTAVSGDAQAQGLTAQNTVNTSAEVGVNIGGKNTGVIEVLVDAVTSILNLGRADAQSGDAVALGGTGSSSIPARSQPVALSSTTVSGTPAAPVQALNTSAASADTEATGAVVSNQVQLRTSAAVRVTGDNYNPITIFLDFLVRLTNRGSATATSGSVSTTGQPGITTGAALPVYAQSGDVRATGLVAQNVVDLWASVLVDITGSNYAPITIRVRFDTLIDNQGDASASSGTTRSTGGTSSTNSRSGDGGGTSSEQSTQSTSQPASNGGPAASAERGSVSATGITGTTADSGSVVGLGLLSQMTANNEQVSVVNGPEPDKRKAINAAGYTYTAFGWVDVRSGDAIAGPTPTPTMVPVAATEGGGGGRLDDRTSRRPSPTPVVQSQKLSFVQEQMRVSGALSKIDPWGGWPARERPWMPGQTLSPAETPREKAQGTLAEVDPWDGWPGRLRPPMPDLSFQADQRPGSVPPAPAPAPDVGLRAAGPMAAEQPADGGDQGGVDVAAAAGAQNEPPAPSSGNTPRPPANGSTGVTSFLSWLALLVALLAATLAWRRPAWVTAAATAARTALTTALTGPVPSAAKKARIAAAVVASTLAAIVAALAFAWLDLWRK
ncbi:MAG: hypothetical protein HY332_15665 [Chloroflexi bacterium]|nr:hypothetical protein [Chloroflexota bacterium]